MLTSIDEFCGQCAGGYIIMQAGTYVAQPAQAIDYPVQNHHISGPGALFGGGSRILLRYDAVQNLVAVPQYETFAFNSAI
jgi:hypothetical protein